MSLPRSPRHGLGEHIDAPGFAPTEQVKAALSRALVEDGVNGVLAGSADPATLAAAIARIHDSGPALRTSTADWFARNARRLSLESSLDRVVDAYGSDSAC